jgi:SAM-dependent methyltransferase
MSKSSQASGSANVQRELWGARVRDWADVQESTVRSLYEAVMVKLGIDPGANVLDVGCGAGLFCELAAKRGAKISGLDATPALIAIARERTPRGDFRVGEMENLPFDDASFDIVTGFNSFQYAASPVHALSEARRVARDGAQVMIATWGKPQDCEIIGLMAALRPFLPPPPPGAPGPFALSEDGALEGLARQAELSPMQVEEVETLWDYADEATALRGNLSAGPFVRAINLSSEERVGEAVRQALVLFRNEDGHVRLRNKFLYLIARR